MTVQELREALNGLPHDAVIDDHLVIFLAVNDSRSWIAQDGALIEGVPPTAAPAAPKRKASPRRKP